MRPIFLAIALITLVLVSVRVSFVFNRGSFAFVATVSAPAGFFGTSGGGDAPDARRTVALPPTDVAPALNGRATCPALALFSFDYEGAEKDS